MIRLASTLSLVLYLFQQGHAAPGYDTNAFLSNLRILDCYGTNMAVTVESETDTTRGTANYGATEKENDTTGTVWMDNIASNLRDGKVDPIQVLPNMANVQGANYPRGRILYVDSEIQRPCFFKAELKGGDYLVPLDDSAVIMGMVIDHTSDEQWYSKSDGATASVAAAIAALVVDLSDAGNLHGDYNLAGDDCKNEGDARHACAVTNFITVASANFDGADTGGVGLEGFKDICATFAAAHEAGNSGVAGTLEPLDLTLSEPAANTNLLYGKMDLYTCRAQTLAGGTCGQSYATGAKNSVNFKLSTFAGKVHNIGTCSSVLVHAAGADYKDPSNVSFLDGLEEDPTGKQKVLENDHLYWQTLFEPDHVAVTPRKMNIVMGHNDAEDATASYVTWASAASTDDTKSYLNENILALWIAEMPDLVSTVSIKAGANSRLTNRFTDLNAFTDKITASNCIQNNCPITIEDQHAATLSGEMWVGIEVKLPTDDANDGSTFGTTISKHMREKPWYAVLSNSAGGHSLAGDGLGITDWFGGITRIPAGTCSTAGGVCGLSIYHGIQQTNSATVRHVCTLTDDATLIGTNDEDCVLLICMWPDYQCVAVEDVDDAFTLDQVIGGDNTISGSNSTMWQSMNGQANTTADLADDVGDATENILYVKSELDKDIHALTNGDNNYPIAIQKVRSRNIGTVNTGEFTAIRPSDYLSPGISGNVDIGYPVTATATVDRVANYRGTCQGFATDAMGTANVANLQYGCGTGYHISKALGNKVTSDPNIHEWSLNNIDVLTTSTYNNFNVMTYSYEFDNPAGYWTSNAAEVGHEWYIYGQSKNDVQAYMKVGSEVLDHKVKFVKLKEKIQEYVDVTDADKFITSLQIGDGGSDMNLSAGWNTTEVRELVADASRPSGTSPNNEVAMPEYSFTTSKDFAMQLNTDPNATLSLALNARVFIVNKSRFDRDALSYNGFKGTLGNCSRPAWASVSTTTYSSRVDATGYIEIDDITNPQCAGLSDGNDGNKCMKFTLSGGAKSLLVGEYELYVQNRRHNWFTKQSLAKATFTIKPFDHNNASYIEANTVSIGGGTPDANPVFDWSYDAGTALLKYNHSDGERDQRGFLLIPKVLDDIYYFKNSIPVSEFRGTTATDDKNDEGKYLRLLSSLCIKDGTALSDLNTTTGAGVEVIECIRRYGTGKYTIYAQALGSYNYIKQTASFTVRFGTDPLYEQSEDSIISKIEWKTARDLEGATENKTFIFDNIRKDVCDINKDKGSRISAYHNAASTTTPMQFTFTSGADAMTQSDECYIQIIGPDGAVVVTPNGVSPADLMHVYHPWKLNNDGTPVQISGPCQNAPADANLNAQTVNTNDTTTNTNYYQIPPIVAEQFRPGHQLKLWVRRQNKKWRLQSSSDAIVNITAYSGSSAGSLITAIQPEDEKEIECKTNGGSVTYKITSKENTLNTNDIVRVCIKPSTYGPDSLNYWFRDFDETTTFCNNSDLEGGALEEHTFEWKDSNGDGAPPGSYDVYTNYKDTSGSSEGIDGCKLWTKETALGPLNIGWARDTSQTVPYVWGSGGVSLTGLPSPNYDQSALKVGTEPTGGVTDPVRTSEQVINYEPTYTSHHNTWPIDLTYPSALWDNDDYYIYWSKANDDSCDCSKAHCTGLSQQNEGQNHGFTYVKVGYEPWPNVGRPNCQEEGKTYKTYFPSEGLYQMCVTKDWKYRGWPVQTTKEQIKSNITLHINPTVQVGTPAPAPSSLPSSSSTVATLFALTAAVLGALIL